MRKATVLFAAIVSASIAFTASAAEMVRYDYDRYEDRNTDAQQYRDTHRSHGQATNPQQAYKTKYQSDQEVNPHPIFQKNGLMRDR